MRFVQPRAVDMAATVLTGRGTATLTSAVTAEQVDVLHARTGSGEVVLLASDDDVRRLGLGLDRAGTEDDVAVALEVEVAAALPDLTVPRAHLVLEGWAAPLPSHRWPAALTASCAGGDVATVRRSWPGARLLGLDPAAARLHWPMGCSDVDLHELSQARPDPVTLAEEEVLARADAELGPHLVDLVRSVRTPHWPGQAPLDLSAVREARCIAADRHGVVLRCVLADDPFEPSPSVGVRVSFPGPVRDAAGAVEALTLLTLAAGSQGRCPYLPGPSGGPAGGPAGGAVDDASPDPTPPAPGRP